MTVTLERGQCRRCGGTARNLSLSGVCALRTAHWALGTGRGERGEGSGQGTGGRRDPHIRAALPHTLTVSSCSERGKAVSSEAATPDPYADPLVFGQRLQILRTRRGMTRDQLGGLLGKTGSWVKGVETGRLKTPKLETILRIAELLRVRDLSDLTGDQSVHIDLFAGPGHPRLAPVKAAVDAFPLTTVPGRGRRCEGAPTCDSYHRHSNG
ncbi:MULTISPECIES: helix-turn-helix domain-containing protein [unclassified Streptomyces]|uniref:helix-turn-helix domain-containing protein n=1 Tax=unclassified Streptomyces TaxID=2593676 RepID=UPI002E19B4E6|nr:MULTISPECIES: helix-turn-helix transcriptional regulator [unclassified Streptomyces]